MNKQQKRENRHAGAAECRQGPEVSTVAPTPAPARKSAPRRASKPKTATRRRR